MLEKRRNKYFNGVEKQSVSLFFSGVAPQKSNDQSYPFSVNRNFYYLTGINQQNVTLVMIKGDKTSESFLYLEAVDPIKALWDGASLTFEQAHEISQIPLKNIRNIDNLNQDINNLLNSGRRAIYGPIDDAYLDLDRQMLNVPPTKAFTYANYLRETYPFVKIETNHIIIAELRTAKDETEIELMKKAIAITHEGLNRILAKLKPGLYEYEIEAEYNYVLNKHRVTPSFDTIAASGQNATILHYVDNDTKMQENDLILFDLGVDYGYYCSDVSRTYPVSGVFTERQKAVYEVVLETNKKAIAFIKPGMTMQEFNDYGRSLLIEGAKKLGLIENDDEITKYYYHSLGHSLGLDVHDVGNYAKAIPEGAVITVEPGLYIQEEGIGIRIEDDILVTKDGPVNLTAMIPKEVKDIEAIMKKNKR